MIPVKYCTDSQGGCEIPIIEYFQYLTKKSYVSAVNSSRFKKVLNAVMKAFFFEYQVGAREGRLLIWGFAFLLVCVYLWFFGLVQFWCKVGGCLLLITKNKISGGKINSCNMAVFARGLYQITTCGMCKHQLQPQAS